MKKSSASLNFFMFFSMILMLSGLYSCQQEDPDAIDPQTLDKWKYLTQSDGLADNFVLSLFEDSQGRIWVGTYNGGVSMYDGTNFTNYNESNGLVNNTVNCIYEDHQGDMWFGTDGGLSYLTNNRFVNYRSYGGYALSVYDIIQDQDGVFWFGTSNLGIIFLDGNNSNSYYDNSCSSCNEINVFFVDDNQNIWVGSRGDLKIVDPSGNFKKYGVNDGLPGSSITSIYKDNRGDIWIGSIDGTSVARYRNQTFQPVSLYNSAIQNWITSIVQLKTGNIWFGTIGNGMVYYDGIVMRTRYQESQGLPDNTITDMIRDTNGNIWIGTSEAGVAEYIPR